MKKTVSIALVVLAALAMFGVGYAWWSDSLYVDGTVNTGTVSVAWDIGAPSDDEDQNKDYSWVDAEIIPNDCLLVVTVENAYPSITYTVPVIVKNTGTIPVDVSEIEFDHVPHGVSVESTLKPAQVHPSESIKGIITIHIDENAVPEVEQDATLKFTGELTATQWNATP